MEHYKEESPMMKILLGVTLAVAIGAGVVAAYLFNEHARAQRELAVAGKAGERGQAELAAAKNEIIALRKEMLEQKAALEQARSDLAMAGSILDAEKAVGARLRQEMIVLRGELNSMRRASGRPVPADQLSRPPLISPR